LLLGFSAAAVATASTPIAKNELRLVASEAHQPPVKRRRAQHETLVECRPTTAE
jgi:hypothetical protein